jgi:hypothetical protein
LAALLLALITFVAIIPSKRRIAVTFDYDFRLTPACSLTLTKNCVKQFNVYDMTDEGRMKLFSIPVPADAAGFVRGIAGASRPILLPAGEHILAVTAESADGLESDSGACATRIQVKRLYRLSQPFERLWSTPD